MNGSRLSGFEGSSRGLSLNFMLKRKCRVLVWTNSSFGLDYSGVMVGLKIGLGGEGLPIEGYG